MSRLTPALAACLVLSASLYGCTALQDRDARLQLVTQYATLKLIDQSSSVTAEGVLDAVGRARAVVETPGEVTVSELSAQVRAVLHWERLDAADQLLLDTLLREAEAELAARIGDGVISPEARVAVLTLLDWIELAARLA